AEARIEPGTDVWRLSAGRRSSRCIIRPSSRKRMREPLLLPRRPAGTETSDAFLEKPAMHIAAKHHARDKAKWNLAGKTMSHYRVIQELGAGGMGVVYLVRDETLDRPVALKEMPTGSLSEGTAR